MFTILIGTLKILVTQMNVLVKMCDDELGHRTPTLLLTVSYRAWLECGKLKQPLKQSTHTQTDTVQLFGYYCGRQKCCISTPCRYANPHPVTDAGY